MSFKKPSWLPIAFLVVVFVLMLFTFTSKSSGNIAVGYFQPDGTKITSTPPPGPGPENTTPPPGPGPENTTPPPIVVTTETPIQPTSDANNILNTIAIDNLCWLSTYKLNEVNIRKEPSVTSDKLGVISPNQIYLVRDFNNEADKPNTWYQIVTDDIDTDSGWVAGRVDGYLYTVVKGEGCEHFIDFNSIFQGCSHQIDQIKNLPSYIQFAYANTEDPCESFENLLTDMSNSRRFERAIENIDATLDRCPLLIPILYSKIVLGVDLIDSNDVVCPNNTITTLPTPQAQTATPYLTSNIITSTRPSTEYEAVGLFLLQEENKPETSALYQITEQESRDLLGTNDGLPKFYPILDDKNQFAYYISELNNETVLWRYDILTGYLKKVFQDQFGYDLNVSPFAVSSDGGYILASITTSYGTELYELDTNLGPSEQNLSRSLIAGFDILSVSISNNGEFIALVVQIGEIKRILVFYYHNLSKAQIGIDNSDIQNQNCFTPSFSLNNVWLYFVCNTNSIYIQRNFALDSNRDQIEIAFNENSPTLGEIHQILALTEQSLIIRDDRSLYLVHFGETSTHEIDYKNGTVRELYIVPDGLIITGVAWAKENTNE